MLAYARYHADPRGVRQGLTIPPDFPEDDGTLTWESTTLVAQDPHRVAVAKAAIGDRAVLFVDANGAYFPKQALELGQIFAAGQDVRWFDEPVLTNDNATSS